MMVICVYKHTNIAGMRFIDCNDVNFSPFQMRAVEHFDFTVKLY